MSDVKWLLDREAKEGYVLARLRLRATDEDGRKTGITTGYRSCWDIGGTFEGRPTLNDAPLLIESGEWLQPGDEAGVRLHPLAWEYWQDVRVGQRIEMREGSRVVGEATVIRRVVPEDV